MRCKEEAIETTLINKPMIKSPQIIAVMALTESVMQSRIVITEKTEVSISFKESMTERITIIMAYAKAPFRAIDQKITQGTACLAFWTSSDIWTAPLKPVKDQTQISKLRFQAT